MSVERHRDKWRVRWRDGTRNRSRTFDLKKDALAWDAEVRRRRQLGTLSSLDAGSETLDEFFVDVWAPTYAVDLAPKTRKHCATLYDRHVGPFLGSTPLRTLTPQGRRAMAGRPAHGGRRPRRAAASVRAARLDPAAGVRERADRRQPRATGSQGEAAGARGGSPARAPDRRADAGALAR
jgi:hypothetical protein